VVAKMLVALWKQAGAGAEAGVGVGAAMIRTTLEAGALVTGLLAVVQVNPLFFLFKMLQAILQAHAPAWLALLFLQLLKLVQPL